VADTTAAVAAGPQPDLAVTECRLTNDITDFGDGIDWWKLRYTYANVGNADVTVHFQEIVHGVYQAGVGNHETLTLNQWPMTAGQSATHEFWITRQTLDTTRGRSPSAPPTPSATTGVRTPTNRTWPSPSARYSMIR
jgi:hypothetical protein